MEEEEKGSIIELAAKAYIFGYPMVYNNHEMLNITSGKSVITRAPVNVFAHARRLGSPTDKFVSVNNDTLYSLVVADVTEEPMVLHVPDAANRYYVMQFIDTWTNNFAYVGRRATGTKEGNFLLAGPGWVGEVPDGMALIQAPTNIFTILGRFQVNGEADSPNVYPLQDDTYLTPLSTWPDRVDESSREFNDRDYAPWDRRVGDDLLFWEQMRSWMSLFPPPEAERDMIEMLRPLGLLETGSPYVDPDPELAGLLKVGEETAIGQIEGLLKSGTEGLINGWNQALHIFDYNAFNLGPGTIDSPEWKIEDRQEALMTRAIAARVGLWGNHGYEATPTSCFIDGNDEQLNGAHKYVLQLPKAPPVEAFWSLTMYDAHDFYLIANEIDRYSIGDRTEGLRTNEDGTIEIYMQKEPPEEGKRSNWLPTPEGDFRPIIRMYQPSNEILKGDFVIPAIKKVD